MNADKAETYSKTQEMFESIYAKTAVEPIRDQCDHCDSEMRVTPTPGGVWVFGIQHDDDCPFLVAHQSRGAQVRAERAAAVLSPGGQGAEA